MIYFRETPVRGLEHPDRSFGSGSQARCGVVTCLIVCLLWVGPLRAETPVRSERAQNIAFLIWDSDFAQAIDSCHNLVKEEGLNPLGYCLLGIAYHSVNSQY